MLKWLSNVVRVRELRRRLLFTAMIITVFRIGSWLPAPGVDPNAVSNFVNSKGSTIFGLLNLLSGSSLSRLSLFALGIVPYVTASIVVQLLTTSTRATPQSRSRPHRRPDMHTCSGTTARSSSMRAASRSSS